MNGYGIYKWKDGQSYKGYFEGGNMLSKGEIQVGFIDEFQKNFPNIDVSKIEFILKEVNN